MDSAVHLYNRLYENFTINFYKKPLHKLGDLLKWATRLFWKSLFL